MSRKRTIQNMKGVYRELASALKSECNARRNAIASLSINLIKTKTNLEREKNPIKIEELLQENLNGLINYINGVESLLNEGQSLVAKPALDFVKFQDLGKYRIIVALFDSKNKEIKSILQGGVLKGKGIINPVKKFIEGKMDERTLRLKFTEAQDMFKSVFEGCISEIKEILEI